MKKILLFVLTALSLQLCAKEEKRSIVVIGGGPTGLAAAIEGQMQGYEVTVVEKRNQYTRRQVVYLDSNSLKRLQKWDVDLSSVEPSLGIILIPIHDLEQLLEKRCQELGVKKIHGEFARFSKKPHVVEIMKDDLLTELSYELLVGADGTHSKVREEAAIGHELMGRAEGYVGILPMKETAYNQVTIGTAMMDGFFVRKISAGPACIVFMQGPEKNRDLGKIAKACGWQEESSVIESGEARLIQNIEVLLQQANRFHDKERDLILLGDAAASASFFEGLGANTALREVDIASSFFKNGDYEIFNHAMEEATNSMIEVSRYLFE